MENKQSLLSLDKLNTEHYHILCETPPYRLIMYITTKQGVIVNVDYIVQIKTRVKLIEVFKAKEVSEAYSELKARTQLDIKINV